MDSKSDLLQALEKEREKTHRYETKLKDLVAAYKRLHKENETLQSTIKSLQSSRKSPSSSQAPVGTAESAESDSDVPVEDHSMQQEIDKLTASLTEMIQEKNQLQSSALAERKALRQQYDEKVSQLEKKVTELQKESEANDQLANELKTKLRGEQIDREREQSDHAAIIREMNRNANNLMADRDDLEHQISELKKQLVIANNKPTQTESYEVMIADLTNQLREMQTKVKEQDNKAKQQITIQDLKHQIEGIKTQHAHNMEREQLRTNEAEMRLQEIADHSERRISELESKVSQLTDMVGNYEKLRYSDQQSIQKLKERVTQLDLENTALAKVANTGSMDDKMNVDDLVDKLKQLKTSLRNACACTDHSVTVDYQLKLGEVFMDEVDLHKKCDEEYSQLKEEFERYKLRAQSVLKNKNNRDQGNNKEMEDLKNTVIDLREKLRASSDRHNSETQALHITIDDLRNSITNLHATHQQELNLHTVECEKKIADTEQRLRQHRDRTINLLAEKDQEIELLRDRLKSGSSTQHMTEPSIVTTDEEAFNEDKDSPIKELLTTETSLSGHQLIHFHQEISRNNLEIATLRKQKHDLESALSELQSSNSLKQEQCDEQIAVLKQEIQRLDRNKAREGVNLEYLKNIVYRYMTATDTASRQSIFAAIATILHFSPEEKRIALQKSV